MRRHRRSVLLLSLFALVMCQMAASAMACTLEAPDASMQVPADCHGPPAEGAAPAEKACPSVDKAPDWGKLPAFQPAFSGADFLPDAGRYGAVAAQFAHAQPQGRAPPLAMLCRLLI